MADKNVEIGINTSGAEKAAVDIKRIEREVETLRKELRAIPADSEQFDVMARKLANAEAGLARMRKEAQQLGTGKSGGYQGNGGMAVLEFSRALEDAQYGIRGVVNNIPSLVLALGGGAGLAGVVSVVAVAASTLWSLFSKGAGDATKEATDYLEMFRELSKEFGNAADNVEKLRGKAIDETASKRKAASAEDLKAADTALKLEQQRIKGDGSVNAARERLNLLKVEDQLMRSSGETAVKLAKQREQIQKNIVALEERQQELLRQAEEKAAAKKVDAASRALSDATASTDRARERSADRSSEASRMAGSLAAAMEERAKSVAYLSAERSAAIERQQQTSNPLEYIALSALIQKLGDAIENNLKNPTQQEAELTVKNDEAQTASKTASENLSKASQDQKEAAEALKSATAELNALRNSQGQQRLNESQLKAINNETEALQKKQTSESATVEGINTLVGSIGTGGSKELQAAAQQLAQMASDNLLSAEELQKVPELLAQFGAQIQNLGAAQVAALQDANGKIEQLIRDVANLKTASTQAPR